jgi:predicted methyltransferase
MEGLSINQRSILRRLLSRWKAGTYESYAAIKPQSAKTIELMIKRGLIERNGEKLKITEKGKEVYHHWLGLKKTGEPWTRFGRG